MTTGSSNRNIEYKCARCGRLVGKENLVVRRVQFREMGQGGKVLRTRTGEWLCRVAQQDGSPSCLEQDPAWTQERFTESPGMQDVRSVG